MSWFLVYLTLDGILPMLKSSRRGLHPTIKFDKKSIYYRQARVFWIEWVWTSVEFDLGFWLGQLCFWSALFRNERNDASMLPFLLLTENGISNIHCSAIQICLGKHLSLRLFSSNPSFWSVNWVFSCSAGTARTSLIVTVGPSAQYYSETASTILFGQRVSIFEKIG